jgi:hypothetical protein
VRTRRPWWTWRRRRRRLGDWRRLRRRIAHRIAQLPDTPLRAVAEFTVALR